MPKKKSSSKKKSKNVMNQKLKNEIIMIAAFVLSIIIAVSVYTTDGAGVVGNLIKQLFVGLLGFSAYILPVYIVTLTAIILFDKFQGKIKIKYIVTSFFLIVLSTGAHIIQQSSSAAITVDKFTDYFEIASWQNGGLIGGLLGNLMINLFGFWGSSLIIIALCLIYVILLTEKSFFKIVSYFGEKIHQGVSDRVKESKKNQEEKKKTKKQREVIVKGIEAEEKAQTKEVSNVVTNDHAYGLSKETEEKKDSEDFAVEPFGDSEQLTVVDMPVVVESKPKKVDKVPVQPTDITINSTNIVYDYPPVNLLNKNPQTTTMDSRNELLHNARKLERSLESFGVKAKVVQVNKGPTVTRYELQPGEGVKVSKIANLADDIALNLAAAGVRIEAPVPGKGVVGIEVANKDKQTVFLREVIDSLKFNKFPSDVAFGLGKDIDGSVVVTDIAKMPHLLVAGATGSGKSVCINTLITSILYKSHPKDVKLILIDPKVVELSVYNGIPHLLIPVVNDPKKAAGALNWAVSEMTSRYKKFAELSVRDVKGFNKSIEGAADCNYEKMPQIVIVIDELADLMMVSPKDVEEAICRLAQMARAAGIHLVIATQRPSVDVITGVIKANIPSRLAFAVSSGTDSRTILDMNGAEKLLGKGDMLFMPIGAQKPIRIQGAFISDKEVENIVSYVKKDIEVSYNDVVLEEIATGVSTIGATGSDENDEHLEQAIELVVDKQKASISMLQRSFRIGFNRAARLMEDMHDRGIVGPEEGSKPRRVLVTKDQLEAMKQSE